MSDSVRAHRRQPARLPRPWDSPGKNAGVGCHFLLQCMKVKRESEVAQFCPTLSNPMDCSPLGSSVHGIFQARVLEWGAIAFSVKRAESRKPLGSPTFCGSVLRSGQSNEATSQRSFTSSSLTPTSHIQYQLISTSSQDLFFLYLNFCVFTVKQHGYFQ